MRYLSICSGIEAATVAWEPLGWMAAAFAEIDRFPSAVLAHHYPTIPNLSDFTKIEADDVGAVDVLVGGTPCQSFSVAGLRGGLADDRGNLALEFLRLADRLRPQWLVWENVPGVLSSNGGRDFGSILGGLVKLGYGFAYRVLDAQFFGVPQRRRRVFLIGHLGDWRRAAAVLFERHSLQGHSAPRRKAEQGVAGTVDASSGGSDENDAADGRLVARCVTARHGMRYDGETETFVTHALRADGFDASEDGTGRGTPIIPIMATGCEGSGGAGIARAGDPMFTLDTTGAMAVAFAENSRAELRLEGGGKPGQGMPCIAFSSKDYGADAGDCAPTLRAGTHSKSHANAGVPPAVAFAGKQCGQSADDLSPSLDSGGGGGTGAMMSVSVGAAVRRLTPRECERLQGFPDDYTLIPYRGKPASDGPRYKALGNSMAIPVMRWIGERIASVQQLHVA
jgi:DNA (cytosine-5)-methyltransferase 1